MRQIILNEKELQDCIDTCTDYANDLCEGDEKTEYLNELAEVIEAQTTNAKWGFLIATKVFATAIGWWEKIEGNSLYVQD